MKFYTYLLGALFLLQGHVLFSQSKFGNATLEELNMTVYPQDSAASAVILSKVGETRFVYNELNGFQFEFTLKVKMKILKSEGLDLCNQSFSYYQESNSVGEKITGLSGTTYNLEDGKIVKTKLSNDYIFDENVEKKWKVKKFSMPAAKVGSVVEFKYTITSVYLYELREFSFQTSVPILYTSYEIIIPDYYYYNVNMQGYESLITKKEPSNLNFSVNYRDDDGRYHNERVSVNADKYLMVGKDIPAIKSEPYLWALDDYVTKVSFELRSIKYPWSTFKSLTTTWGEVDRRLLEAEDFGGNLKKTGLFKDDISNTGQTLDRAVEILGLVKSKVKWNDQISLTPDNLKDALKTGMGNSADINFLLINALKAGGFNAYPVVMSSRGKGRLPIANPPISELNYAIAAVEIDTLTYYTDAASKFGAWNVLPERSLVTQARAINGTNSDWVDLSTKTKGISSIVASVEFTDKGMKSIVKDIMRDEAALKFKGYYEKFKDQSEYTENLSSRLNGTIEDFEISGENSSGDDVRLSYTLMKSRSIGDDMIYFNPLVERIFTENPFKAETRKFPVNFDCLTDYKQIISVTIPEGYVVEELPQSTKVVYGDNELTFLYRIAASGNRVQIQYYYQINKLELYQESYSELQDFFTKMVAQSSAQIVLKKAGS